MLTAVGLLIMKNKKVVTVVKRLMALLTVVQLKRRFLGKVPGLIELEQN